MSEVAMMHASLSNCEQTDFVQGIVGFFGVTLRSERVEHASSTCTTHIREMP